MFFNQMEAIYNRYKVSGAKVTIQITNNMTNANLKVCMYQNTTSTVASSFLQATQRKGAQIRLMSIDADKSTLSVYVNFRKVIGRSLND